MARGEYIRGVVTGCLLMAGVATTISASPLDVYTAAYYIPTAYSDSFFKTDTTVAGAYSYFGLGKHTLEVGYDNVLGTVAQESVQKNYLAIYGISLPALHTNLKTGFVAIRPEGGVGNGNIGLISASYDFLNDYGYKKYSLATEGYFSSYDNFDGKLTVAQVTPVASMIMAPAWQKGWLELTAKANYISASQGEPVTSEEVGLKYVLGKLTTEGRYYMGESIYGIYNGGFVAYNTSDILKEGFSVSMEYAVHPKLSMKLTYQTQALRPQASPEDVTSSKVGYLATYHF